MTSKHTVLTREEFNEYMYTLRLIWLLTDKKIVSDQLNDGISKNQIIEKMKDTVKKSKLISCSPEPNTKRFSESIFFIIEQRVNECGKLNQQANKSD
ncbi:hypothetical protein H5M87_003572 [Salmonella enterica]|nr:hypothetical protein [Salmonella enterica]